MCVLVCVCVLGVTVLHSWLLYSFCAWKCHGLRMARCHVGCAVHPPPGAAAPNLLLQPWEGGACLLLSARLGNSLCHSRTGAQASQVQAVRSRKDPGMPVSPRPRAPAGVGWEGAVPPNTQSKDSHTHKPSRAAGDLTRSACGGCVASRGAGALVSPELSGILLAVPVPLRLMGDQLVPPCPGGPGWTLGKTVPGVETQAGWWSLGRGRGPERMLSALPRPPSAGRVRT